MWGNALARCQKGCIADKGEPREYRSRRQGAACSGEKHSSPTAQLLAGWSPLSPQCPGNYQIPPFSQRGAPQAWAVHKTLLCKCFSPRALELAFAWLHGAVTERSRFKSLISPIWIDVNFPWLCLDHWAVWSASGTEPSGRLEVKWLKGCPCKV